MEEVEIPLKLKWNSGKDMPFTMAGCQAIVIGDNVYVGGGGMRSYTNRGVVMVYKICTGSWRKLSPHVSHRFGMATVNNQLVLVGGIHPLFGTETTNVLRVWDEGSQTWTRPFPEMLTPRHSVSVITYQKWLVVAGGIDENGSDLNKVEILDTQSRQWYNSSSLPEKCSRMATTINGNMWYLLNRSQANKHVFGICLDDLISHAVLPSISISLVPLLWHTLTDSPLTGSTILIVNGALLAVGGEKSSAIHLYQPRSRTWVKVSDLPTKRSQCACVVLPSGEILVAGGRSEEEQDIFPFSTNRVDIATY